MIAETDIDGPAAWRRLALCLAIAVVGNVGMWSIIVLMPWVETGFGLDRAGASLPYTATMLGFALGNVVFGGAVDRLGLRSSLLVASAMIGLGFAGAALAPGVLLLAAAQFVAGLGASVGFGPILADISQWFRRRRGLAVGIAACGNYLSGAVWPLVLVPLAQNWGWRAAAGALAVAVPLILLPLILSLRGGAAHDTRAPESGTGGARISPDALTLLLCVAGVACCVAMSMPQVHMVAYCVDLGYGPAVGGQMLSAMLLAGVVSRLISGLLGDWLGGLRTVLIGSVLQGLSLLLYLPWDGLVSLYVIGIVFGLGQGGIVPGYALIVREFLPARIAGARVGLVMMATILGMALGGWLSGAIHDWTGGYHAAFLNGLAWNLVNVSILAGLLWFSAGRRPRAA